MAVSQGRGNVPDGPEDLTQIKRKLAWRMSVAGLMIIGLLAGLWLFDSMTANRSEPVPPAPQFTEPVPVAKKSVTQPLTSAEPAAETMDEAKTAVPESTAAPSPPEIAAQPSTARQGKAQVRAPVAGSPAAARADAPSAAVPPADQSGVGSSTVPARQRQPQVLPRLLSGVSLQAGVFADPRRAEELHARLLQEGIPATLETRVLVGPFRDRQEADAARAKMLAMGIETVQLQKSGKK